MLDGPLSIVIVLAVLNNDTDKFLVSFELMALQVSAPIVISQL